MWGQAPHLLPRCLQRFVVGALSFSGLVNSNYHSFRGATGRAWPAATDYSNCVTENCGVADRTTADRGTARCGEVRRGRGCTCSRSCSKTKAINTQTADRSVHSNTAFPRFASCAAGARSNQLQFSILQLSSSPALQLSSSAALPLCRSPGTHPAPLSHMRILVTGGTGVVGTAAVTELLKRGHLPRLLSRHAEEDARQWPERSVETFNGDVTTAENVRGAADGCDAVLHLVAIVAESPPDATFQAVNVDGTHNMLREAERAGVPRFIYVSSLGADRGESPYHRSKLQAEEIVSQSTINWTIMRPGNVYGTGDEQISLVLQMVRSLPVVPILGNEETRFQPIWSQDLAIALAKAVERDDLQGQVLELAGDEQVSMSELIDRLCRITNRKPARVPMPQTLAGIGLRAAKLAGVDLPVDTGQLTMFKEGNVIADPASNALVNVFGVTPTPMDDALRLLADALPEQLPDKERGALTRKRFWADITDTELGAEDLFARFRASFSELTPSQVEVGAEPGTPVEPRLGETLTLGLPLRGHVQVRVHELEPTRMTFITLAGHPLAGAVTFFAEPIANGVRFEIQAFDRPATVADWLTLHPIGARLQDSTWRATVESVIESSGGDAPEGVQQDSVRLSEEESKRVAEWLEETVMERKREENAAAISAPVGDRNEARA
jgi:uncharacterized protein YbjT (DUF2867 family)